ncbi:tetratricopeptide repeat protein [Luethyella okanaganae]|uniref:Tetratricopeptide repeat protein n=1 Tax=Luethyella okanaganae TaxID=69372 RepID=A0ABW1VES6_9MICO
MPGQSWQERVDAVWGDDTLDELEVVRLIDVLVAERPADDAIALFEAAGARDSAGFEAEAEQLYRQALDLGLPPGQRSRAVIQLASTIRNLGKLDESIELLRRERETHPDGQLADATSAFLALALASRGEAIEGLSLALTTLAAHLPRYQRSVRGYAAELLDPRP